VPYTFQILAQMLSLHTGPVPETYRSILPFLVQAGPWQQRGSVPGLVKLLSAFLARDGANMAAAGQHLQVLAVVQQRLIPSKINDVWGFELLKAIVQYLPTCALAVPRSGGR
jgi:exportin-2 (importin alpha re-exporter)